MRFLSAIWFLHFCLLPTTSLGATAGEGFGESLRTLASARQAGTGGLTLEDPWRQGTLVDTTSIVLSSGLDWYGISLQGGVGPTLRLGFDAFGFSPSGITQTTELADGTFGSEGGKVSVQEWGARLAAQLQLYQDATWRVAGIGRVFGLVQRLPDMQNAGVAADVGAQAQRVLAGGTALIGWAYAGPVGSGAGYSFASQVTVGGGLLQQRTNGLLGGPEGYGAGVEGAFLTEGIGQGGLGALYWFGRPSAIGTTFFLRAGAQYTSASIQAMQPRGGVGVLWRTTGGWGFQFDYAFAPLGALGSFHYATIGIRLPGGR